MTQGSKVNMEFLTSLKNGVDVGSFDWCSYIVSCLQKTKLKWNGYQHYNGPLTFLLLLYAHDSYERANPKGKKMHAIRFNSNESLDKLDKELLNEPNINKVNLIEVKKSKKSKEWASMIRSKVKELDSFVVDVEKLITRCLQEIQTDDVILNPIEEWMSRFTKYNEMTKNKHKADKEGVENKQQEVHSQGDDANEAAASQEISQEISRSLLLELIDAVVKVEVETEAKKKEKMDENIHLQDVVNQEVGAIPQMVEPMSQISPTLMCDLIVKDLNQQDNIKEDDDKKGDGNLELVHQTQEISSTLMNDMIDAVNKVEIEIDSKKAELKEDKIATVHLQEDAVNQEGGAIPQMVEPISQISPTLMCDLIVKDNIKEDDDKKGDENLELVHQSQEISSTLMNDMIDAVNKVEIEIDSKKAELKEDKIASVHLPAHDKDQENTTSQETDQLSQEISHSLLGEMIDAVVKADVEICANLEGKVVGHDDEIDKQKSIQSTKKGKEIDDELILVKIEKRKPMVDKGKHTIKLFDALRSPYKQRVVQLDKEIVKVEERVSECIFAAQGEIWEHLFDTTFGDKVSRICFESLYPSEYVHAGIMTCWSVILNNHELYRSKDSPARLFCPCNMLGENNFKPRMRITELFINFEINI
ncbi:hypothetical protein E3N88_28936 [Mikania micrantha]|uniref:Uncharacterized protein n=1 Tax=Mikania micrantha TaxID=192012 RepID=A0A5N6N3P9_9ASTR|nr:hypothetical protein E3N88_28936 [Mikania micrantha]